MDGEISELGRNAMAARQELERMTEERKRLVCRDWNDGDGAYPIAQRYGISRARVYQILRETGAIPPGMDLRKQARRPAKPED